MNSNGAAPVPARSRVVVLLTGPVREPVASALSGRRDLVVREYTSQSDARTPIESVDVVLHVTRPDASIANEIAALQEQTPAPIVLALVGEREGLVDEALETALADILILPQPADVIAFAVRKAARRRASGQAKLSRVVMVSSTKGGTGKTSIAANLAVVLAEVTPRTLLIDLDVQFGDVGIVLGLDRPEKTLHDLASAAGDLDPEKLRGYVIPYGRLDLLPAPLRPEEGENIDASKVASIIQLARTMYDTIVIDTAPIFDGPMLAALDRSDQVLLVSTPDVPSMKNVRLALQTLQLLAFPVERVALVANRAGMPGGATPDQISETIGRTVRFALPEDPTVPSSINSGIPAVLNDPRSRFSRGIREIAGALFQTEVPARRHEGRLRMRGAAR